MKKTLAVLFLLAFLLSLGGFPAGAQAQAQPSSYGYVPLVTPGGNASVPLIFRARQQFNALAPRLLAAQAKGQVVRFEPELDYGLLKVEYRTGFNLAAALAVNPASIPPVFAEAKSALDTIQAGPAPIGVRQGVSVAAPQIWLGVFDSCFSGTNLGPNYFYAAFLFDTAGRKVASQHNYLAGDGSLDNCFNAGVWRDMAPGFAFVLNIYNIPGGTLLASYSTLIARINITSITAKTKTFKGTGPANDAVHARLVHPELDAGGNETYTYPDANTSSKGAWSLKLDTSVALRGGDEFSIAWPDPSSSSNTFIFYRYLFVPYVDCELGGNFCSLYGIPGKTAKLSLAHGKSYKASGIFDSHGWFGGSFYAPTNDPVFMIPGDRVTRTGAPVLVVPSLTAVPDRAADTVSGQAPASRFFEVDLDAFFHVPNAWNGAARWVGSDAGMNYTADFSGSIDIFTADIIEASVYYVDPLTGNETDTWNFISE